MTEGTTDKLERIVRRLALSVAVFIAFSIPMGYGVTQYAERVAELEFKARVKASALTGLIASVPTTWMFAVNHIRGLISREPVPLEDELVQVFDGSGLIAGAGALPASPVLTRSYPLFDSGTPVGKVIVTASLSGLVKAVLLSALLSSVLAVAVYAIMKVLPIRALKAVTAALHEEKERAETTLHTIGDAVVTTDAESRINYLNPAAERLLGHPFREVQGQPIAEVIHLKKADTGEPSEILRFQPQELGVSVSSQGHCELVRPGGETVAVEVWSAPTHRDGKISGGVLVLHDESLIREYVRRRSWEATHDALTHLVNRREFEVCVANALADSKASGRRHVVCFMDLDRFKVVNDSAGHAAGDELLIQLSHLMQKRIRDTDTLARLGGDEFGLLLRGCDEHRGRLIATEIVAAVNDFQFVWEGVVHVVGVSVGIAVINSEHRNVAEIIGEADCACYWAKEQGRNRVTVFVASDMHLAARRSEASWITRIRNAFRENRFVLYQQSYRTLDPSSGHNDHLEVLIRMIGEDGEVIEPGRFLPAAERYNLMPEIDRWVIREVFSRYGELLASRDGRPLTCAINLSGASVNWEGMLDFIKEHARTYDIRPGAVCFELTETVAVRNLEAAAAFIGELQALGFQFALDDFGTGTSSFGYLKNLPVDYLKIDGGFVKDIEHDDIDQAMVETINHIGHLLGKRTVAEWSENEAIIERLKAAGVDFAQGYGVARPKPLFGDSPCVQEF